MKKQLRVTPVAEGSTGIVLTAKPTVSLITPPPPNIRNSQC